MKQRSGVRNQESKRNQVMPTSLLPRVNPAIVGQWLTVQVNPKLS